MKRALFFLTCGTLVLIVGLPVLAIVLYAIFPEINQLSLQGAWSGLWPNLSNPDLLHATLNSLMLSGLVTVSCCVLGVPLGWMRSRMHTWSGRFWDTVFLVPFLIPPYIGSLAWIQLAQPNGFFDQLLGFHVADFLYSLAGMVTVMALNLFPLVYFSASRSFALVGQRYADVARVFGATSWIALRRIDWPLVVPAVVSSGLMVFILTLEEFGTPEILGRRFGFEVMVTAIHDKFTDWPIDLSGASVLCLILIALAYLAYQAHRSIASRFEAQIDGQSLGDRSHAWHGLPNVMSHAVFGLIGGIAVALPLASIIVGSLMERLSGGLRWSNFSGVHFREVFAPDSDALDALFTSVLLASGASIAAVIIGVMVAFTLVRGQIAGAKFLDILAMLPNAVPGMAVAVGLILTWNLSFWPWTPYNTVFILLLAYVCLMLPYPIRMLTASLRQLPESMDQAAAVSGASTLRVIWQILFPLLWPSALAAGCIVFAISTRELVTSLMLTPPGINTVATFVFRQFDQGSINVGMAMSVVTIVVSGAIIGLGQLLQKRAMK